MKKTKDIFFRALAFLILFLPLSFAGPGYVECEDLDRDEWLDPFVTPQNSVAVATIIKVRPSNPFLSNFCSETHSIQYHSSWDIHTQLFASEPMLSVPLRC